MKKRFIQICSLFVLVVGLTAAAQAQKANRYEASVPFDFSVGNKTFAAGDYAFGLNNPLAYQSSLTIRELKSGKTQVVIITREQADDFSNTSQLVFNRYEDRYFLTELTTSKLRAKFSRAKTESRLAKEKTARRETVALKR